MQNWQRNFFDGLFLVDLLSGAGSPQSEACAFEKIEQVRRRMGKIGIDTASSLRGNILLQTGQGPSSGAADVLGTGAACSLAFDFPLGLARSSGLLLMLGRFVAGLEVGVYSTF
mgnify:FL=1